MYIRIVTTFSFRLSFLLKTQMYEGSLSLIMMFGLCGMCIPSIHVVCVGYIVVILAKVFNLK